MSGEWDAFMDWSQILSLAQDYCRDEGPDTVEIAGFMRYVQKKLCGVDNDNMLELVEDKIKTMRDDVKTLSDVKIEKTDYDNAIRVTVFFGDERSYFTLERHMTKRDLAAMLRPIVNWLESE